MAYRRRWTVLTTAGLAAYVTAMAVLVVLMSGDPRTARQWFFAVAILGALVIGTLVVQVRRRRARRPH